MSVIDYYTILETFIPTIDNLPSEIHFILSEIRNHNEEMKQTEEEIRELDLMLKPNDQIQVDGEENPQSIHDKIQTGYLNLKTASQERINLITRAKELLDKHLKALETQMPAEMLPATQTDPTSVPKKKLLGGVQLYCICQQVSYGEMIGCDNIVGF